MDYTLAIDQGTHASRAVVFDSHGRSLGVHTQPVELVRPRAGRAEQNAVQLLATVRGVADAALQALTARQRRAVRACGICTQRSTVVAWHRDGTPLGPAIGWQDTRGAAQIERLKSCAREIRRLSGLPLSPHYGASKLHWLQQYRTGLRGEPSCHCGPLAAWLLYSLTGGQQCLVDHCNAQRMQLLDVHRCDWSPQLLQRFDVSAGHLPACRPVIDDYGELAGSGIPVTASSGDQNAAWFGYGKPDADTALVNIGSGAFILAAAPEADINRVGGLMASIAVSHSPHACRLLVEGTVNGAGSALQWLQQRHPDSDIASHLEDWLAQESDPPVFLNSVGGLGSPWWEYRVPPAFHPADERRTPAAEALAVAESILFLLQVNLERLQPVCKLRRLRVSGGLARLDPLCRKLADLSGLTVVRPDYAEASARGIAWLAAGQPADWSPQDNEARFQPHSDPRLAARYRQFREQLQKRVDACPHD